MAKNTNMSNADLLAKVADLNQQIETVNKDKEAVLQVANIAANQLLIIESKFSPLLAKKFNFWNALANLKEWIALVQEVLAVIREFKAKFITPAQPALDTPK